MFLHSWCAISLGTFGKWFRIIGQDAHRGSASVLILSGADGPEEGRKKTAGDDHAQRDQKKDYVHDGTSLSSWRAAHAVRPLANKTTVMELTGMRTAQTMGDSSPRAAMAMPMTL